MQDQSFDIYRIEMKHAGFTMINPDDGMIVRLAHGCVLYDATSTVWARIRLSQLSQFGR
jgi:hypothetical protein